MRENEVKVEVKIPAVFWKKTTEELMKLSKRVADEMYYAYICGDKELLTTYIGVGVMTRYGLIRALKKVGCEVEYEIKDRLCTFLIDFSHSDMVKDLEEDS